MTDADRQRALDRIAKSNDAAELGRIANNAAAAEEAEVLRAARLRLYAVSPSEEPGTLEHAVWQSIYALEGTLSDESGTTKRLSRTRQKIGRDGEQKTVADLVMGKPTPGFTMLVERDMVDLTFEAVALKFPDRFSDDVLGAAKNRLADVPSSSSNTQFATTAP
jgi:hypothetical protein